MSAKTPVAPPPPEGPLDVGLLLTTLHAYALWVGLPHPRSPFRGVVIGGSPTGASADGARGLARIKQCGGVALVQAPDSAASPIMPEAALAATPVDAVAPAEQLAALLTQCCAAQRR